MRIFEPQIIIGIVAVLLMIVCASIRYRSKRKVKRMGREEKIYLLEELTKPFGFIYKSSEDIFTSYVDAWQRKEGYEALYDRLAGKFNMIFDALPVYFDYRDKTWLIEFWKGQYGINTGCEVGVYHTNRRVPKNLRKLVRYNAIEDEDMPLIQVNLEKNGNSVFSYRDFHWWLTGFQMGTFSNPEELTMYVKISFLESQAARAFYEALKDMGYPRERYRIQNQTVSLMVQETEEYTGLQKWKRGLVQCRNRCFCFLYRLVTFPFRDTVDRMLFLYYQLPWCFRHMLRLHAFGRKHKYGTP